MLTRRIALYVHFFKDNSKKGKKSAKCGNFKAVDEKRQAASRAKEMGKGSEVMEVTLEFFLN